MVSFYKIIGSLIIFLFFVQQSFSQTGIWAKKVSQNGDLYTSGMVKDKADNLYVTGYSYYSTQGTFGSTILTLTKDVFLTKLDSNGNFKWAVKAGGPDYDIVHSIAIDAQANIYISGSYSGTSTFGSTSLTSTGYYGADVFLAKYDSSGAFIWVKDVKEPDWGYYGKSSCVKVDANGDVFLAGNAHGGPITIDAHSFTANSYLAKFSGNGNLIWAKDATLFLVGQYPTNGSFMDLDEAGNLYLAGKSQLYDLSSGSSKYLTFNKYDPSGTLKWSKKYQTYNGFDNSITSISYKQGNIFMTGTFYDSIAIGNTMLRNPVNRDYTSLFVAKLDTAANEVWAKTKGGIFYDEGCALTADNQGNCYMTGYIEKLGIGPMNYPTLIVTCFDVWGNEKWNMESLGTASIRGTAIQLGISGAVYVAGNSAGVAYFNPLSMTTSGYAPFMLKLTNSAYSIYCNDPANAINTPTIVSTSSTPCPGDSILLVAQSSGPQNFQWSSGSTNDSIFVKNTGVYSVVTKQSGCYSPTAAVPATFKKTTAITLQPSDKTICANDNVLFTLSAQGTNMAYKWQVNQGAGFSDVMDGTLYSGAATDSLTITNPSNSLHNSVYRCHITGECAGDVTSESKTLSIKTRPVLSALPDLQNMCVNGTIQFDLTVQGTNLSYQWQKVYFASYTNLSNSGVFSGTNTHVLTLTGVSLSETGNSYRCLVSGDCIATPSVSDTIVLTVHSTLPTVGFVASSQTVCEGTTVVLSGTGANSYTWDNGVIDGMGFTPDHTKTYTVTGEDNNHCTNTSQVQILVNVCTDVQDAVKTKFSIFPNPARRNLTIEVPFEAEVKILNSVGVAVSEQKLSTGLNSLLIPATEKGLYLVQLIRNNQVIHLEKVIFE